MHPYLLHSGHLFLPTFGLLAAAGLLAALSLSLRTARTVGLPRDRLWDAGLFALLAAFLLSRLLLIVTNLHSFLTYPILLLTVPSLTEFGLLLTAIATLVYLHFKQLPLRPTLDAWAPCATLAWAFLALGHFAEGSDPGLPTTLPWALRIPPDTLRLHPIALYAMLLALALTALLHRHLCIRRQQGETAALALALTGVTQFLLTFLRQPNLYPDSLGNLLDPIQWAALGMIALGALLYLLPRKAITDHAL